MHGGNWNLAKPRECRFFLLLPASAPQAGSQPPADVSAAIWRANPQLWLKICDSRYQDAERLTAVAVLTNEKEFPSKFNMKEWCKSETLKLFKFDTANDSAINYCSISLTPSCSAQFHLFMTFTRKISSCHCNSWSESSLHSCAISTLLNDDCFDLDSKGRTNQIRAHVNRNLVLWILDMNHILQTEMHANIKAF